MKAPRCSRRQFLARATTAASALAAAPLFAPASVLGRGFIPPSERVTMGFIGVGGQGGGHLLGGAWTYIPGGYTARPDVQVVAVCDIQRGRREYARQRVTQNYEQRFGAGKFPACEAYTDFRRVLDRADIDAVLIATPAHWHATMAVMAAQAGKDMYCEKPSATTIRESQAMLAAVERHGVVYQAGTQQRSEYDGYFRRAVECVRAGRLGTLKEIYAYRDGGAIAWPTQRFETGRPVPDDIDWDLYLGPAPWFPYDGNLGAHRFDLGELNWGQHHYDIVQWAADADGTGPVELWLEADRSCYKYASGVVVYGKPCPGERAGGDGGLTLVGTAGRLTVDRANLYANPEGIVREPLLPGEAKLYRSDSHSGNFLECVRTRKRPICDARVAQRSVSAVLLGGIVKLLRRPLKWDPQQQIFPGDEEANRLLSIAQRPPWRV
jgi:hypothetical protein